MRRKCTRGVLLVMGRNRPLTTGGLLAQKTVHTLSRSAIVVLVACCAVVAVVAVSVFALTPAIASYDVDSDTIGIGAQKSTVSQDDKVEPSERIGTSVATTSSASSSAARSITVKDPDPVIAAVAVDYGSASYRPSYPSRRKRRMDARIRLGV